ncbi:hypothetical protein F7725_021848 [Dissostichus mawsoni]|uniref:deoxyribose-phosphate aldolase n=1 Tax=Dissostichus mawsoni TaxID=36200 RepID=A0A7J5ZEL8_DISMA|nr:hypothetical protein F7725_021848 [Dissostichus mawsoni]
MTSSTALKTYILQHLEPIWVLEDRDNTELLSGDAQEDESPSGTATIPMKNSMSTRNPGMNLGCWTAEGVTCIDLTTLAGDDTPSNVHRLCLKAIQPVRHDLLKEMDMHDKGVTTGRCWPLVSQQARRRWRPPPGSAPGRGDGATEIDIVINRTLAITGQWEAMYDEIRQFREACGDAHMKTILAIGELGTFTNVYKASLVSMMAGSDFIKTSTGKESVNATYPVAIVMVRAIRDYFLCTGYKVQFLLISVAGGGIRTAQESLVWLTLIKEELGNDWLSPLLFRLGASSLLADIERQIYHHVGRYAAYHELPMA